LASVLAATANTPGIVSAAGYSRSLPPLLPEQSLDLRTALSAYTRGSARVNHLDDGGRVAVGALADLVVLDRDVTTVAPAEISGTRVDLTLVDGRPVFER